jgi:hypothetical protein
MDNRWINNVQSTKVFFFLLSLAQGRWTVHFIGGALVV